MKSPFKQKKFMSLVFPGFCEVLASLFILQSEFMSDDLPTLDLPTIATSERMLSGYFEPFPALVTNSAFFILKSIVSPRRHFAPQTEERRIFGF
jgi:hypothetical protein